MLLRDTDALREEDCDGEVEPVSVPEGEGVEHAVPATPERDAVAEALTKLALPDKDAARVAVAVGLAVAKVVRVQLDGALAGADGGGHGDGGLVADAVVERDKDGEMDAVLPTPDGDGQCEPERVAVTAAEEVLDAVRRVVTVTTIVVE